MSRITPAGTLLFGVVAAASLLAACGSSSSTATTTTSTTSAPSTTSQATNSSSSTLTRLPYQTATSAAFLSPTGNIACEIDTSPSARSVDANGNPLKAYAECQTTNPAQTASLAEDGTVTQCPGANGSSPAGGCIGNPGLHTPTLAYGNMVQVQPFSCVSATTGITCSIIMADGPGKGFQISRSGITLTGTQNVVHPGQVGNAGSANNCTEAELVAALPSGLTWDSAGGFGCAGNYAYAYPTSAGNTVTALFQLENGTWVDVDRSQPCQNNAVPPAIYQQACETN